MQVYKSKWFGKWADKEDLTDQDLSAAVKEMVNGLIDADLGGHVMKKRVALQGKGKSGGTRTLLAFKVGDKAFFIYGFAKNQQDNISAKVHASADSDHSFRSNPITHFGLIRSPISVLFDHF